MPKTLVPALACLLVSILTSMPLRAQHTHPVPRDTTQGLEIELLERHDHEAMEDMSSTLMPGTPMARDASGTAWLPDVSPLEAVHTAAGGWNVMVHGAIFPRFAAQDVFDSGTRGQSAFGAPSWIMGMANRPLSESAQLSFRSMLSLDPLIEGGNGYPLLLQTGETFEGERLVDRQHPHDLISELAAVGSIAFSERAGAFAYVGYPGEPALGPPAFMHRPSARHIPDSPLGHHWQDATHISFGVATLGVIYRIFKLDASLFTGREPDEDRIGWDEPRFDSYSARIAINPTPALAVQLSRGFMREPEALEPGVDVWRTTGSVLYHRIFEDLGYSATSLVWGMNSPHARHQEDGEVHEDEATHTLLLESDLQMGRQSLFTRIEWTDKPVHELDLPVREDGVPEEPGSPVFGPHAVFNIASFGLGTSRALIPVGPLKLTAGVMGTFYKIPADLEPIYGTAPISLQIFLRLVPLGRD